MIVKSILNSVKTNVICLGTPTIFAELKAQKSSVKTLLMDLDDRLINFYSTESEFVWYNMFTHHFIAGDANKNVYENFLRESEESPLIVLDPPFGGKPELISRAIEEIQKDWRRIRSCSSNVNVLWIFPYFMEAQIQKHHPLIIHMSDYQVEYDNHSFGGRKLGSPVRIFTDLPLKCIDLSNENGYEFCAPCAAWMAASNRHCEACGSCTSKNGGRYVHCSVCERCVKETWRHCEKCGRCALEQHPCGEFKRRMLEISQSKQRQNDQKHKKGQPCGEFKRKIQEISQSKQRQCDEQHISKKKRHQFRRKKHKVSKNKAS